MTYLLVGLACVAAYLYRDKLLGSPAPAAPPAAAPVDAVNPMRALLGQAMDHARDLTIQTAEAEAQNAWRRIVGSALASHVASLSTGAPTPLAPAQTPPPLAEAPRPRGRRPIPGPTPNPLPPPSASEGRSRSPTGECSG